MSKTPKDEFVPDTQVIKEFGIATMTLWRWDRDPKLGFPPPITIRLRKFRSRLALEEFKARMQRLAIERHTKELA